MTAAVFSKTITAHRESRLGCEHMFPDELKGLTVVAEGCKRPTTLSLQMRVVGMFCTVWVSLVAYRLFVRWNWAPCFNTFAIALLNVLGGGGVEFLDPLQADQFVQRQNPGSPRS